MADTPARSSGGRWALGILILFVLLLGAGVFSAYQYGEGYVYFDDRTISELEWWEVVGGVALGIAGLALGLIAGLIGVVVGLVAAVLSIVLALLGVATGLLITAGVILGPFLLIAGIIILIRRSGRRNAEPSPA